MDRFSRLCKPLSCLLVLVLGATVVQASASSGGTRLCNPAADDGAVNYYKISPSGSYAVYSTINPSNIPHLFSVPLNGGAPVSLTSPIPAENANYSIPFQISPDGNQVIFAAREEAISYYSLYRIPIGGGNAVRLSKPGVSVNYFDVSPDNQWVIFNSYDGVKNHLWRAALTGSTGSSVDFTPSGAQSHFMEKIKITPDSQHFLVEADLLPISPWGIYSFPITGSGSEYTRLSMPLTGNYDMDYLVTPDSQRLIYRYADTSLNPVLPRLYSVPMDGPATSYRDLSEDMISGGGVYSFFQISPNGHYVVFGMKKETTNKIELYSYNLVSRLIPILVHPVKLNVPIDDNHNVNYWTFKISPDSTRVVYSANQNNIHDLFSVPINGPIQENVKINNPVLPSINLGWDDSFNFSPDSSSIVFTSMQDTPDFVEVYMIPSKGPASSAVKLNPPLVKNAYNYAMVWNPMFSPDGRKVFYTANLGAKRTDLVQSPAGGPIDRSINLSVVPEGYSVSGFTQVPNSTKIIYQGPISSSSAELFITNSTEDLYLPLVTR